MSLFLKPTSNLKFLLATSVLALAATGCTSTGSLPDFGKVDVPGVTKVETVKKTKGEISIPYKKYVLDNGLTVVLHEDKSDPLVHVDITYHVGSGREEPGRSGFAHFFEHMQFQGSDNVGDEEHFKTISEAGGTLNGSTNTDRTNYYETVPSNQLEKMLWLEADRMGFFLDAVTQDKFEVQRETVKNERGQNYDNRPYGLLREKVNEAMYPEGHPYSWLTIGYIEDLNRADLNDLKSFFLRWYGPNNATLTIGGDLDEAQTLAWIAKYFGSIPAGPAVEDPVFQEVTLERDKYISYEDNVALPLIYMAWPTVAARHPDEAPLDVLMNIIGTGKTSLLYKNMVKEGLAVQAQAGHGCSELHCTFVVLALPDPASGATLADLETIGRESLMEFETRGVMDDDLTRVKAGIVSSMIYGLESVSGKVSQLAAYETYTGNPNYIGQDIARYEGVSKEDVTRVYNKYIKDQPSVVLSIVPKGKSEMVTREDNWKFPGRTLPETAKTSDDALKLRVASDDFDRSVEPGSGPNPSITVPQIWNASLDNGVEILGAVNDEVPTTTLSLRIKTGLRSDPLEKVGLAALTAGMMDEQTTLSTNEDLSNRLDKLGSSVSFSAGDTYTTMRVRSLTENLDETLAIAHEKLMMPKFDEDDFERVKNQTLQSIEVGKKEPANVAGLVYSKLLYGDKNSFAYNGNGTTASVNEISLDDVKQRYADTYSAKAGSIVAVSDLSRKKLLAKLAIFNDWSGSEVGEASMAAFPELKGQMDGKTLYLVDKEGAAQSQIWMGKRAMPFDATGEYYKSGLMNFTLGGAFNSRININLREDKGYTYGARSYFRGDEYIGSYTARAGVRSDITDKALVEFEKEIRNYYENGITADELIFTKNAIGLSEAREYETPRQKLGFLSRILTYNLDEGFVDLQNDILANISKEDVDALAKQHLNMDEMIIVIVGDKKAITPGLKDLGYKIVELDDEGHKVK